MSSEDEEINEEENEKYFTVRRPQWRSEKITAFFAILDKIYQDQSSSRSKFRKLKRKQGAPSTRQEPKWTDLQRNSLQKLQLL